MKTTKLALFNSVKGNYSQKSFQPKFELKEVVIAEKKMSATERKQRLAEFKARKAMQEVSTFCDAEYDLLKSADSNFSMTISKDILGLFPTESKALTKAQIRARHRAEVRNARRGK